MRGDEKQQPVMFSYIDLEQRVPAEHPLRAMRRMVDQALADLSVHFDALYARRGRPSIPPEATVVGLAVAGAVLATQRAATDGADRFQLAVPLVCGAGDG